MLILKEEKLLGPSTVDITLILKHMYILICEDFQNPDILPMFNLVQTETNIQAIAILFSISVYKIECESIKIFLSVMLFQTPKILYSDPRQRAKK